MYEVNTMPKVSLKGRLMPESPIRKLVPYAEKAEARGINILRLNIGQPDIKTPQEALDAVKNNTIDVLAYTHSAGLLSLRKKLSTYYAKHNIEVNTDEIIVTTGGSEALLFTMGCVADFGDEIIIPEPFYANYYGFATAAGVNVVPVISNMEDGFALPPIKAFESHITEKTRAIVICNPGNPTGYLYTQEELIQLADLAKRHGIFLISDEVYREFCYDGHTHHSILSLPGLEEHAIMVDSVSKRYSMCGARIGCVVSRNKELMSTLMKFAQIRLSPPTLAQIASEAALDVPQSYYDNVVAEYKERRDTLVKGLKDIPGVTVTLPQGAFYCIASLPVENAENFCKWLLDSFDLDGQTVMLAPADGFYSTAGIGIKQVRIAYVLNKKSLEKAIEILKLALIQYNS